MAEQIENRVESSSTRRAYREDWDTAINRLAIEAEQHGVEVYEYQGRWFATSQSEPHRLHAVNLYGCDCKGYQHHGRCRHLARLLDVTGNLPGRDDQPEPPAAMTATTTEQCPWCFGSGHVGIDDVLDHACDACHGRGRLIIHMTGAEPVAFSWPPAA